MEETHPVKVKYENGKYICGVCGTVLQLINASAYTKLNFNYKLEADNALDTDYDIDWEDEITDSVSCGHCGEIIGQFDSNIIERILRNNADKDPEPDPDLLESM
jgi:hypothetical protein